MGTPPRAEKTRGRKELDPEATVRVRELFRRVLERDFRGNRTALARRLGISQSAVTKIDAGGGIARTTAFALAKLAGADPYALIGETEAMGTAIIGRFPGLETCLAYHGPGRWPPFVVAAARGGVYKDDASPKRWEKRLDALLERLTEMPEPTPTVPGITAPEPNN